MLDPGSHRLLLQVRTRLFPENENELVTGSVMITKPKGLIAINNPLFLLTMLFSPVIRFRVCLWFGRRGGAAVHRAMWFCWSQLE